MGITARGVWELVERHFRDLGRDLEAADLTVVGVGDMSGDVFGNGMLMSRRIRLLGAFDHRHLFIDPDPDPERTFAERQRLFDLPRSSWADYDHALISLGGGVFERTSKSIPISREMSRVFDISDNSLTPTQLVRKILAAPVDLLWFGGIGTFIKARDEDHMEVGGPYNAGVLIDGEEIRASVVGEAANLAVTQRGRIAYALAGGRINTDAIDNSAGIGLSDHEVNVKILIDRAIASGLFAAKEREPLLASIAGDLASLVLHDSYLQGQALSVAEACALADLDRHARLMRDLERLRLLDRSFEFLPDDETLLVRAKQRRGLVRPELAILTTYAKIYLKNELLASDLIDAPELMADLIAYFPSALRERFRDEISTHPLRREIIATAISNDLIHHAGITFVSDMRSRTGHDVPAVVRAYLIVRDVFELPGWWHAIASLDNSRVMARTQTELLIEIGNLLDHAAAWLLRCGRLDLSEVERFLPNARTLAACLPGLLPESDRLLIEERASRFVADGVPRPLAGLTAAASFLATALEITDLAERSAQPLDLTASIYHAVGSRFALYEMRAAARRQVGSANWQKLAVEATINDLFALQVDMAAHVLANPESHADPIAGWIKARGSMLSPANAIVDEFRTTVAPDLAMLGFVVRQFRQALR